jgi:hypothetical protein
MRVDLRQNIIDYEGKPLPGPDGKPEVLRNVFATALNNTVGGEVQTPEAKSKAYELTVKIYARKQIDLTLDERKLIKDRVGVLYSPLVFGRVSDILEENDERENPTSLEGEDANDADENKDKNKVKSK